MATPIHLRLWIDLVVDEVVKDLREGSDDMRRRSPSFVSNCHGYGEVQSSITSHTPFSVIPGEVTE